MLTKEEEEETVSEDGHSASTCWTDSEQKNKPFCVSPVMSQLSWIHEHGQQVPVVAQVFDSAAPQSCSALRR